MYRGIGGGPVININNFNSPQQPQQNLGGQLLQALTAILSGGGQAPQAGCPNCGAQAAQGPGTFAMAGPGFAAAGAGPGFGDLGALSNNFGADPSQFGGGGPMALAGDPSMMDPSMMGDPSMMDPSMMGDPSLMGGDPSMMGAGDPAAAFQQGFQAGQQQAQMQQVMKQVMGMLVGLLSQMGGGGQPMGGDPSMGMGGGVGALAGGPMSLGGGGFF